MVEAVGHKTIWPAAVQAMKRARITMIGTRIPTMDTRTVKMPPSEKVADAHYGTPEHRAWALEVKRRAGWRCEIIENGQRCKCSKANGNQIYAGHIKNLRDHPELATDPANGRAECNSHNTRAGIQDRAKRLMERFGEVPS